MRRYWLSPKFIDSETLEISGEVFHHIFDVCRQEQGSVFEVLLGDKKAHVVKVSKLEKKSAQAKILEARELPVPEKPHLHLCMSIPRFPVLESVLEKAVEMGVSEVHLFFSEYSFVRKANSVPESKKSRWDKIVISATQQSGRGDLMKIHEPIEMAELLNKFNQNSSGLGLFAYEGDSTLSIKAYAAQNSSKDPDSIWIFIGAEGGFSLKEVQDFRQAGLETITLGAQVLRVETACISLVSILKYEFGK